MNRKITEYKVVMAGSPAELSTKINALLLEGWIPTGGIFITQSPVSIHDGNFRTVETHSHQAMLKVVD